MRNICFYFQVHQPFRLRKYRFFDVGANHDYYDDNQNRYILKRVAEKCYIPMNNLLLDLIKKYGSDFKVSFSLSGVVMEQFKMYQPDVLESFQKLASTGNVEFLSETYSHSLASLRSKDEFINQVYMQSNMVKELFGQIPQTFRNTELIYSNEIGSLISIFGFKTMLTEGANHILGWRSPNFMYNNPDHPKLKILLKNYRLSDDIAFRFSQRSWNGWPLTTEKFVNWLNEIPENEQTVNLFMDYETFGEHQWAETGIFDFMRALPERVFSHSNYQFHTPSELNKLLKPVAAIDIPHPISWADEERDTTAWLGNVLQNDAFSKAYEVEERVRSTYDEDILRDWRYLQTSDHFYYMCTKFFNDGDVHKYFNPFDTPYQAYVNYMNILSDFIIRLDRKEENNTVTPAKDKISHLVKEFALSEQNNMMNRARATKVKATKASSTFINKTNNKFYEFIPN